MSYYYLLLKTLNNILNWALVGKDERVTLRIISTAIFRVKKHIVVAYHVGYKKDDVGF